MTEHDIGPQAQALAQAIGLLDAEGDLVPEWFENPLEELADVLSDTEQRDATVALLDLLLPEEPGGSSGWRRIVSDSGFEVFLTTDTSAGTLTLGVAGRVTAPNDVRIDLTVPLVDAPGGGADPIPVIGAPEGPIRLELHVPVGLSAPPVGLDSIDVFVDMQLQPSVDIRPVVELIGLQLGSAPAADRRLDTTELGEDVVDLVLGLLEDAFSQAGVPPQIGDHLLPLLGLGASDASIPRLPLTELPTDPAAFRGWLRTLAEGGGLQSWLGHLAGLLDAPTAVSGTGTPADPWRAALFEDTHFAIDVTAAVDDDRIWPGLAVRAGEDQASDSDGMHLLARTVVMGLPYVGLDDPLVAPDVQVLLRSQTPLVAPDGGFGCGRLQAGITWDGSGLVPLLELLDVLIDGESHDRVDLTQAEEIGGLAQSAIEMALRGVLGDGPGVHLLALTGIIPPSGADASWPHDLDVGRFLVDPIGAIGAYHRAVLQHGTHTWALLHAELSALLGLGAVTGSGTEADPWAFALASSGAVSVRIDAWRVAEGGTESIRVGLAVAAQESPFGLGAVTQLVALTIPDDAGPSLQVGARIKGELAIDPLPAPPAMGSFTIDAAAVRGSVDWSPDRAIEWDVRVDDVRIGVEGAAVPSIDLRFPGAALDFTDPAATAASLGISAQELDTAVRGLVWRAARSWGGRDGQILATLAGFGAGTWDIPVDFPVVGGDSGTLIDDPLGAYRAWFGRLVEAPGADGQVPLRHLLHLAHGWLEDRVPETYGPFLADRVRGVEGEGSPHDPWRLDFDAHASVQARLWVGPDGPALPDLPAVSGGDADVIADLAGRLRATVDATRAALEPEDGDRLASGLEALGSFFAESDGVVPVVSQQPDGWTSPAPIAAAHADLPAHPDVVTAVREHVQARTGNPVVLLLSAPFADRTAWTSLLGSAGLPGSTSPDAHFELRVEDIEPAGVDLQAVTATAEWYTADLGDPGDTVSEEDQIRRIVDRLAELAPGRPVVLVAHSTTGLAARRVAAGPGDRVAGIVTIGTPHVGARPPWAWREDAGLAIHAARSWVGALPAGPTRGALESAIAVVDGADGAPWVPGFLAAPEADTDVGAVPALALAGRVGDGLGAALETVLREAHDTAGRAAPADLHASIRATLGTPVRSHDLAIRTTAELLIGRIGLADPSLDDATSELRVRVDLDGAGGWLVGGPGLREDGTTWPARCRRAALVVTVAGGAVEFDVELHGAEAGLPSVLDLDAPGASPLLDAVFARLSDEPLAADLLADLERLGLAVPAPSGGVALSSDAVSAFRSTGLDWLRPRLQSALVEGLAGLDPSSAFEVPGDVPVEVEVDTAIPALRLSTAGDGIELGGASTLALALEIGVPGADLAYDATLSIRDFDLRAHDGGVTLSAGSWMEPLPLLPADPAALGSRLEEILPRLVFSAATAALVEATLPEGLRLAPLDRFILGSDRNGSSGNGSEENGSSGNGPGTTPTPPPPPEAIVPALQILNQWMGNPPGDALVLPGDIALEVTSVGDATRVSLATGAPLGDVVELELGVDIGPSLSVTPTAGVSIAIPDTPPSGGTLAEVEFSHGASGTRLEVRPSGAGPITLLPAFSGFGSVLSGGVALLPRVLDELDDAVPAGPVKTAALDVATAMEIYDAGGGFAPHTARFQELLEGDWNRTGPQQAALVAAARSLVGQIPSLPGTVGGTGTELTWALALSGGPTGSVTLTIDWADDLPTISAGVDDLSPAGAPVELDAALTVTPTAGTPFALSVGASLVDPLDLPVRPGVRLDVSTGDVTMVLEPLALVDDEGPLVLRLLPTPDLVTRPDLPERVVSDVVFPLLLSLLDRAVGTEPLWAGGPTARAALSASGLVDGGGRPVLPPPPPLEVLAGAATALSATIGLGDLDLVLGNVGGGLGVGVSGRLEMPIGDVVLELLFESPDGWLSDPPPAPVRLVLLRDTGGWGFHPRLDADGLGIGLAGGDGDLVRTELLRLGSARAYTFFGLGLHPWDADLSGAGVSLDGIGLPLNQLTGGGEGGGGNGVVAGLLNGGDAAEGEPTGAQPALGIDAWYLEDAFHVRFDGEVGPYWIAVQSAFGPLYIEQVGVGLMQVDGTTVGVDLLVDGGASLAGLSVMVDDLTLGVPFRSLGRPGDWSIDLAGLAISYVGSGVRIAGGLVKSETEAGVEYIGMLKVDVQSFGLVAIGAWGSLADEEGDYTSLFVFAALFLTISFPPYLEIRGIGLGFGYNRRLVVPEDVAAIPGFPLVSALDSAGTFLENPMAALEQMKQRVPARRGSYWFAVGFHGTTFVVVHITAVLHVAIDSGAEVGVLGVARMVLPTPDTALVSIELALKARYSSSEGLLSIQGQLTDNSWLLSRDCQLTGGFAFFMWFERGQFLLTIGGYHPSFQREPEYPEVPRVGIRWALGPIDIKGESYFALTNSAVMAGVRIEASYTLGSWLKVWFKAWTDFLLQWDPFYYEVGIGVSLGARVTFTVNLLFGKVRITLSISIGAELLVMGPPLRGVVKAKLGPFKVTVAFGSSNADKSYIGWTAFRDKYVLSEDPAAPGTALAPGRGLLQPEQKGSDPPTGESGDPWRFNPEFGFRSETRMPASSWQGPLTDDTETPDGVDDLDSVPMNAEALTADHVVTIERRVGSVWRDIRNQDAAGLDWDPTPQVTITVRMEQYPEAVWRRGGPAAASSNVSAIGGLELEFHAEEKGVPTEEIPISTLVDEGPRAPNPFTRRRENRPVVRGLAEVAVELVAEAEIRKHGELARVLLTRGGRFEEERVALGISDGGLDEVALQSLERRTTPPSVASLSADMTMEPLTFEAAPDFEEVAPVGALVLDTPRLRAVAALPAGVARPEPVALRTTVTGAPDVPRVAAPSLDRSAANDTLGARLVRVPAAGATPPTREARRARTTKARFTGAPSARAGAAALERMEEEARGDGVALGPGRIHHWEIPSRDGGWRLELIGRSAVRVVCLGRGSRVVSDQEHVVTESRAVELPAGTHQVVAVVLGRVPDVVESAPQAVSSTYAPGGTAAVGWQADSTVFAATESLLLGRGCRLRLDGPTDAAEGSLSVASRALAGRSIVQTWLPARTGTVAVVMERRGAGALEPPELGMVGGSVGEPLQERAGRRHVWLYPVSPSDDDRREMAVTVSSGEAWGIAGVVLLPGEPRLVGARLNGGSVPRFISDGPIAETGTLRLRLFSNDRRPR